MVAFGYIWKVVANIVVLIVVTFALNKLHGRSDSLVISVLGMIYVTIRSTQGFQGLAMMEIAFLHQKQLDAIRSWIDGTYQPAGRAAEWTAYKRIRNKFYIDCCFLAVISVLCGLTFFGSL